MTEPLPCPFCGGPATVERTNPGIDIDTPAYFVRCIPCGISTKAFRIEEWQPQRGHIDVPDAKDKAIAVWNKRV